MAIEEYRLREVRSFSDTITVIFEVARSGFKPMMRATVRICAPWLIIGAVATAFLFSEFFGMIADQYGGNNEWSPMYSDTFLSSLPGIIIGLLLALIALSAGSALQMCIVYLAVKHYAEQGSYPDYEWLRSAIGKYFWRTFFAAAASAIMINIATQFFYLPGIYLSVPLGLLAFTVVAEDADVGKALSRVFVLIKDRWWYSFGIILVVGLAQAALLLSLMIPGTILSIGTLSILPTTELGPVVPILAGVAAIAIPILLVFASFITYISHAVLYYQHSERIEGVELGRRLALIDPGSHPA